MPSLVSLQATESAFVQPNKKGIGQDARLVFITHRAKESDVQACVSEFRKSPAVRRASGLIRVIGE
jgi:homoserine dehydrogenase